MRRSLPLPADIYVASPSRQVQEIEGPAGNSERLALKGLGAIPD